VAYKLKSTGIAANCTMLIALDPDTGTVKDFASAGVTEDMTVTGLTTGTATWDGNTRSYFSLAAATNIAFGDEAPTVTLNTTTNPELTIVAAVELDNPLNTMVFGTNSSNYFSARNATSGVGHPFLAEGASSWGGDTTISTGERRIFGFGLKYDDGYSGALWTALHDDSAMTTGAMTGGTITSISMGLTHVGSRNGSGTGFSDAAKWFFVATFDAQLSEAQWDSLRDDWFNVLLEPDSGSTPIAFSGTVPAQNATVGTPFSLNLSTYFSGTETPFTYAVQSGTLPTGLTLNSSTGEITGTPTTAGTASGIVIRATDGNSDTADSNSFSIDVAEADTTAPVLTSPTGTATGQTTASGTVDTDEGNGTLYWLTTTNSTESAATVKGGSSQAVTATGEQSVGVTGLTAATGYYLHYVHRDAAGNDSTVASSSLFTTDSVPVPVPGVRIQLHDGATEQAGLSGLTVAWFDDDDPATMGAPVLQSSTETTDASGWLEVDLDGYTALDIDDPGFLIVYKAGGTPEDDLVFAGRLPVEDIA